MTCRWRGLDFETPVLQENRRKVRIPLPDAETVFRTLAAATGPHLKRLPDGETGIRKTSIRFLQQVLARNGRSACALALRSSRPSPFNRHSPDSRQFEARIAPLIGLGNGKFRLARARGGRSWRWRDQDS